GVCNKFCLPTGASRPSRPRRGFMVTISSWGCEVLPLSQTLSGWQLIENQAILLWDEGVGTPPPLSERMIRQYVAEPSQQPGKGRDNHRLQRMHADDLVAHVQQTESWDVLSFAAIAEQDETYDIVTPYGRKRIQRKTGEILQPTLLSATTLEIHRRAMTDYNFTAQYQQNPQPPSGNIVK